MSRRRLLPVAAAAAAAALAIALAWWAPWDPAPSAVARARDAIGNRPILHVIARTGIAPEASATRSVVNETRWEIWYDRPHRLLHVVGHSGGKLTADRVERANVDSTYLALSLIDPALGEFVAYYRSDLADGHLRPAGSGTIQDRRVRWLRSQGLLVGIDPASYEPLWLRRVSAGRPVGRLTQISDAETIPPGSGDFQTQRAKKPRHL